MLISRCVIIAWKISTEIIWTENDRCKEIRTPHIRQKSILSNINLEDCYFVWSLISISRVYVSVICNIMFLSIWIIYNELFINYNLTNITFRFMNKTCYIKNIPAYLKQIWFSTQRPKLFIGYKIIKYNMTQSP